MNSENKTEDIKEDLGPKAGPVSSFLTQKGFENKVLEKDHLGIEIIGIKADELLIIATILKESGFNYLQCQGGYDEGPGLNIVCFYHLIEINENQNFTNPREIRLKVFLNRDGDMTVPSLYPLFHGADWQERETFDMYGVIFKGHPHPKRLLMPEDWKGWPLRKDYIQPDFYEMQDAY